MQTSSEDQNRSSYPQLRIISCNAADIYEHIFPKLYGGYFRDRIVLLRGKNMKCYDNVMQELSAAFQFPYYFGNSYSAASDCLSDLDWMPALSYKVIIYDADHVLDDDQEELPAFYRTLGTAQQNLWEELHNLELSGRGRTRLNIILHAEPLRLPALKHSLEISGFSSAPIALDDL